MDKRQLYNRINQQVNAKAARNLKKAILLDLNRTSPPSPLSNASGTMPAVELAEKLEKSHIKFDTSKVGTS